MLAFTMSRFKKKMCDKSELDKNVKLTNTAEENYMAGYKKVTTTAIIS